jgi:hypothetical protein
MAERYVRPPLVAQEAPSAWTARWRFWTLLLILAGAVVFLLLWFIHPNSESSPGVGALAVW